METMPLTLFRMQADDVAHHEDGLIELLRDAVDGGASVSYLAPLQRDDAQRYWQKVAQAVEDGGLILLGAVDETGQMVGSVQLALAGQPNGLHRAEVQKLLVHSNQRRQGTGRLLMQAIEAEAQAARRSLLVLDTERDSVAERYFYESMGYQRAGSIPGFALSSSGETRPFSNQ